MKKMKLDFHYFETREDARRHCGAHGIPQSKILKLSQPISGFKWAVPKVVVHPTRKKAPKGL